MKSIWRVLGYLKHYPWHLMGNILLNMLAVVFNLFTFVMIVPFVELLFGTSQPPSAMPPLAFDQDTLSQMLTYTLSQCRRRYGLWKCLVGVAGGYLTCSLLSNLCRYMAQYVIGPVRNGIIRHMRDDVYERITVLPVDYFHKKQRGDIISRMSNDLADIEWGVLTSIISIGKDPLNVIVFSAVLIFISPRLFLYFLLIMPLSLWLIGHIGKRLRWSSSHGQNQLGQLFAQIEEALTSIRVIQAFGREKDVAARFAQSNDDYARTMVRVAMRRELSSPLSEVLITLGLVFVLVLGGFAVIRGEMLSSVFILFVILFARLIPPVQSMVRVYNNLQKANAGAARFFEIIDADETIYEKADAIMLPTFSDSIQYHDVSFAYPAAGSEGATYVLQHLSVNIPKGRMVAIVGPSGAGKTTMVDLLSRFYDCSEGTISIDGHDIRNVNINSLRAQIGLVSQNCILFNDTIANNIAFGHGENSIEAVRHAAQVAHAESFIEAMQEGYDTMIGDRGVTLSGGQRQRISIARAVLKDSPILILDEATSALDTESELAVQQALEQLMQGRTTLVIAHRLSTIYHADEILVMDHGHIVERGNHQQLLEAGGLYKHLVEMQSFA